MINKQQIHVYIYSMSPTRKVKIVCHKFSERYLSPLGNDEHIILFLRKIAGREDDFTKLIYIFYIKFD